MVIIIAEIGENHCGDMEKAKRLIQVAKAAGCDIVKFQSYDGNRTADSDPEKEWFKKVNLSDGQHFELKKEAEKTGIEFLSTPLYLERAKFLVEELGLKSIKVASFQIVDHEMLDYINNNVDRVFLSTGMSTIGEVDKAVEKLNKVKELYLLHCISEYPTPETRANIRTIKTLQKRYQVKIKGVGYSDHTTGTLAAIAAAAIGAAVIEKHITLDKNCPEGTDHILAAEPEELKKMVAEIRRVEKILGTGKKELTALEKKNMEFARNRFKH